MAILINQKTYFAILFKFVPGMESRSKNKGFILDLLMQFGLDPIFYTYTL